MDRGAWTATVHGVEKELDTTWWLNNKRYRATQGQAASDCTAFNSNLPILTYCWHGDGPPLRGVLSGPKLNFPVFLAHWKAGMQNVVSQQPLCMSHGRPRLCGLPGVSVLEPPCPLPWDNFLTAHLALFVPSPEQKAQLLPWVPETAEVLGLKNSLSLLGERVIYGQMWWWDVSGKDAVSLMFRRRELKTEEM